MASYVAHGSLERLLGGKRAVVVLGLHEMAAAGDLSPNCADKQQQKTARHNLHKKKTAACVSLRNFRHNLI